MDVKRAQKTKPPLYRAWDHMKTRCFNRKCPSYHNYGGRGITICSEWLNYNSFEVWALSNGYKKELSLDRIDNNGNYEPSNCRWATAKTQSNNKRTNRFISYNGESHTIAEWADKLGVHQDRLYGRLHRGWSEEKTLSTTFKKVSGE